MIKFIKNIKTLNSILFRPFADTSQLTTYKYLENKIGILTINNPKQKNALSNSLLLELSARFSEIKQQVLSEDETAPKVIILTSVGNIFSSGHNLKEIFKQNTEQKTLTFQRNSDVCLAIRKLPIPVIAQVNGQVMAGGLQLMCACDMVVASNQSKYSCAGIALGLYCSTPAVPFIRSAIAFKEMFEFLTTGKSLNAKQALQLGIINCIAEDDGKIEKVHLKALELAEKIAKMNTKAIQLGKTALYDQQYLPDLEQAYRVGIDAMMKNLEVSETLNNIRQFVEKKKDKDKKKSSEQ